MKRVYWAVALAGMLAAILVSQPQGRQLVGQLTGGRVLLPTGAVVNPAGKQFPLDTFPMTAVLTPNKKHLLILHGGYNKPSVVVHDPATMAQISSLTLEDAWLGLAVSPDGKLVYVSGATKGNVHELRLSEEGKLEASRVYTVTPAAQLQHTDFLGDVAVTPDGRLVYVADLFHDQVRVINPQSGRVIETFKTGRRPYRILFHPDGKSYFVSSWADASIYQYETDNGRLVNRTAVGPHPTDMVWREKRNAEEEGEGTQFKGRLFVAVANTNTVKVLGIAENRNAKVIETINVSLYPDSPAGMTPSGLGFSEDQSKLFVACSDANAAAVVDVTSDKSLVEGFIPTGWYPTAVRGLSGNRLLVLNGRGSRSFANPGGPSPIRTPAALHGGATGSGAAQYVGRLQRGSASVVNLDPAEQMAAWTGMVRDNTPYRVEKMYLGHRGDATVIPAQPSDVSPIQHVLYIIKENRTYDQVLGDIGKGNSDPSLTVFGKAISPNHHKLAEEFVLLDNFYVNADVSADGHNWSMAAIAPDYVQKMWPNSYGGRRKHYDYEGGEPAALPPAGYIWNNVLAKGLTMRNFGYFVTNEPLADTKDGIHVANVRDPALIPVTHPGYRGFDLEYMDIDRAKVFVAELVKMEANKNFPRFTMLRLGNDHTSGAAAGKLSPIAQMADNDYALGMIVDALSHSSFWSKMAIFVLEDDAQNGPDHVDSHRSPAYVISPYVKRGAIDSGFYNTTSMLRTMELILGMRPMTMHDAGAPPMLGAFTAAPDLKGYSAEKPTVSLETRNPARTALAARSARFNFQEADEIDDDEMNDILWRAIKGTEPPAPVRSIFGR